uniref:Secreted protein n=2 Tax=Lutzomyia longipalpis TaxID=7200 RepID=A0A1B0CM99_LUTLO
FLVQFFFFILYLRTAHSTNPPKWEKVHTVKGNLIIPYAEISEPFYAWYDENSGRSRIDYYGGMVKTYQLTHSVSSVPSEWKDLAKGIQKCCEMLKIFLCVLLLVMLNGAHSTNPPKWEKVHTVKGNLIIPYAEISEPFYAWYDENSGRSRIDYYGGMVKTYQLTHSGTFGTSLKVAPVTTDDTLNHVTCLQVNGTDDNKIEVQSVLPNAKDFRLIGTEDVVGLPCDKFYYEEVIGQKKNTYTLWVRYKKSPKYPAARMPIPVRYEMRGFNTLLGSHYDHYYLEYDYYSHEDIPDEIFEVDMDEPCTGFPGPGAGHYATFNPMKEFVHPRSTEHVEDEFRRFITKHGKDFGSDLEQEYRRNVFTHNL